MSGTPVLLRVRLAFGDYPVGYVFRSPPLPGTVRQEWLQRGYLEVVPDEKVVAVPRNEARASIQAEKKRK